MIGSPHARGVFLILVSALLFYLATFFIRLASAEYAVPGSWYLVLRFLLGVPVFYFLFRQSRTTITNSGWMIMRAVFNVAAVIFFLYAAHFGSAMNANVLNMTYPAFVALLSPIFVGEKSSWLTWLSVFAAIIGATLITLGGRKLELHWADFFGLASGITAGFGVMSLKQIRKTDSTFSILYYTFLLGAFVSVVLVAIELAVQPKLPPAIRESRFWVLFLASGLSGVIGQWIFTYGFAWVGAVEGSLLSSTRIIIALVFGVAFFEERLTAAAIIGALLILISNIFLGIKR